MFPSRRQRHLPGVQSRGYTLNDLETTLGSNDSCSLLSVSTGNDARSESGCRISTGSSTHRSSSLRPNCKSFFASKYEILFIFHKKKKKKQLHHFLNEPRTNYVKFASFNRFLFAPSAIFLPQEINYEKLKKAYAQTERTRQALKQKTQQLEQKIYQLERHIVCLRKIRERTSLSTNRETNFFSASDERNKKQENFFQCFPTPSDSGRSFHSSLNRRHDDSSDATELRPRSNQ